MAKVLRALAWNVRQAMTPYARPFHHRQRLKAQGEIVDLQIALQARASAYPWRGNRSLEAALELLTRMWTEVGPQQNFGHVFVTPQEVADRINDLRSQGLAIPGSAHQQAIDALEAAWALCQQTRPSVFAATQGSELGARTP